MRTIKNFGIVAIISINLLLIPSTTFASWWNPTTWFTKKAEMQKNIPTKLEAKNEGIPPIIETKEEKSTTTQKLNTIQKEKKSTQEVAKINNNSNQIKIVTPVKEAVNNNTNPELKKYYALLEEQKVNKMNKTGAYNQNPGGRNISQEEIQKLSDYADYLYDTALNEYAKKAGKRRCENNTLISMNEACANPQELQRLINEYNQILKDKSSGTGMYKIDSGVQYSPDQIMSQRSSTDDMYNVRLQLIIPQIIRLKYYNDPVTAQQMLDDFRYNQLEETINSLNKKINTINSKQNKIQGCIKDLTNGNVGYGCN